MTAVQLNLLALNGGPPKQKREILQEVCQVHDAFKNGVYFEPSKILPANIVVNDPAGKQAEVYHGRVFEAPVHAGNFPFLKVWAGQKAIIADGILSGKGIALIYLPTWEGVVKQVVHFKVDPSIKPGVIDFPITGLEVYHETGLADKIDGYSFDTEKSLRWPVYTGQPRRIVFVNDFGDRDFYVGSIKGAIYTKFPGAQIDSITHEVPPYGVREGSYVLAKSAEEFPEGTVFCSIVDPGVGTKRRSIVFKTKDGKAFVGPDNGLFTHVLAKHYVGTAHEIVSPAFLRNVNALSSTFHGRDVYGPTAASLAAGLPLEWVGPPVDNLTKFHIATPRIHAAEPRVSGEIEYKDWYGNIITNIPRALLEELGVRQGDILHFEFQEEESIAAPYVKTYAEVPEKGWFALANSGEVLEIGRNQDNTNGLLQVKPGMAVSVWRSNRK